jgi:hypothetical protein
MKMSISQGGIILRLFSFITKFLLNLSKRKSLISCKICFSKIQLLNDFGKHFGQIGILPLDK